MNGSQHLEPRPADHDFFKLKTSFLFIQLTSCGSAVAPDLQRFEAKLHRLCVAVFWLQPLGIERQVSSPMEAMGDASSA